MSKESKNQICSRNIAILCGEAHKSGATSGSKLVYDKVEVTIAGVQCTYTLVEGEPHVGMLNASGAEVGCYSLQHAQDGGLVKGLP